MGDQYDGPQWAEAQYLGDPQSGSFEQGDGVSTQQLQNPNISVHENTRVASGHPFTQSLGVLIGIIIIAAALKYVVEIRGGKPEEFRAIKLGLENWLYVFILASSSFYVARVGVNMVPGVPGAIKQYVGAI